MKQTKKILALALAASMAVAPCASAATTTGGEVTDLGDSASIGGTADPQGYVDKRVVDVVLPTTATNGLDFKADPQGLLTQTDPTNYTLGAGAVYFANKTNTSDAMEVKNKSSIPVTITPTFTVTDTASTKVQVVQSATDLLSADKPSIYFGIITNDDTENVQVVDQAGAAESSGVEFKLNKDLSASVPDVTGIDNGKGYLLVKATEASTKLESSNPTPAGSGNFKYGLSKGYTAGALQTISYKVTAACDINASLWDSQSNTPKVSMGWSIAETTVDGSEGKDTIVWDATGATTFKLDNATVADVAVAVGGTIYSYTGKNKFSEGNTVLADNKFIEYNAATKYVTINPSLAAVFNKADFQLFAITDAESNNAETALKAINIKVPEV